MRLSDFSYHLPKESIAQHPPKVRGDASLLVLDKASGGLEDRRYKDIVDYLQVGDVLVLNDTRVIKARLSALDADNKEVELVLLEKHGRAEDRHLHGVLYRGHLAVGDDLRVGKSALRVESVPGGGTATLSSSTDFTQLAQMEGKVPLPPYMKRSANTDDELRYQTTFAQADGSVAAPTASLNMTPELLSELKQKGVEVCFLTLHVGLGTFLPIRTDEVEQHIMHSEYFEIPADTTEAIRAAKRQGNRIFALGTTVARTLEFAHKDIVAGSGELSGEADIFIRPGYEFKLVDGLVTNFHAPKSTVLMLAAAFAGWPNLKTAYAHALQHDYRFLSYGDSMLIL